MQNCLITARLGRSSAQRLQALMANNCTVTQDEAQRLVKRILAGFDAVLGAAPEPTPPSPPRASLRSIQGGIR